MNAALVKTVSYEEQYPLRRAVLGQGLPPDVPFKPGDDNPETLHVGVYVDSVLVSIASLYHEAQPDSKATSHWRLRGMATLLDFEGQGYGRQALDYCIAYARQNNATRIWCNARENAIGFYQRMNFRIAEGPYDLPGHGQRWLLVLDLMP